MNHATRARLPYVVTLTLALCLPAAGAPAPTFLNLPGNPFMALPSADGSVLFVTVQMPREQPNRLYVFRRHAGRFNQAEAIRVDGLPAGLALSPDGETLVIADGDRYAEIATGSITGSPALSYLNAGSDSALIEVVTSADGNYAFFSNESRSTIDVVRLRPQLSLVSSIGVERAPVGLDRSPDGRYLYATSELSSSGIGACGNGMPAGRLSAIDVSLAQTDPRRALIASASAGCDPVRVAGSPDGRVLWVTVRGANRLATFDAAKLRTTPAKALIASLEVGEAPVGLLASSDGEHVVVANSNRFNPNATSSTLTVVDAKAFLSGATVQTLTLGTGAFPREITESTTNGEIYVTNFAGHTVEVIPAAMLGRY
jgi:DNA-binding beta-propeller fold protein YncE